MGSDSQSPSGLKELSSVVLTARRVRVERCQARAAAVPTPDL